MNHLKVKKSKSWEKENQTSSKRTKSLIIKDKIKKSTLL